MYRIITNKCFVANRETMRTPRPLEEAPEPSLMPMENDPAYRDVLQAPDRFLEQCGDEVNRAMKKLSTVQRTCIMLRSADKFSYKEIAEILDIPVGTVMTHLSRGRAKLRKELLSYAREQGVVRTGPRLIPKPQEEAAIPKAEGGDPI
jgi:RNA polymerase sigma-70 factor (ECF subfamily)